MQVFFSTFDFSPSPIVHVPFKSTKKASLRFTHLRFLDAYKDGASGSDVVARTREMKKGHRAPLVMPDDQRKRTYRRKRRVREGETEEGEESDEGREDGTEAEEGSVEGRKRMEEEQIVFDQDEFGGKLRQFLWQYGHGMVHKGLATIGERMPCKKLPELNFLAPQLYFHEIADQQRLSEIDLEMELEVARSGGEGEIGLPCSVVLGADGDKE